MAKNQLDIGKTPHIIIEVAQGDLALRGSMEAALSGRGDFTVDETPEGLVMQVKDSLRLNVPEGSSILLREAKGDVSIKGIQGKVTIDVAHGDLVVRNSPRVNIGQADGDVIVTNADDSVSAGEVHGDIKLRNVGSVNLGSIDGDLSGRYLQGSVEIGKANGDVNLHTVSEDLHIGKSQRDVNLSNLGGLVRVESVDGDIRLRGSLSAGKHHLQAQGDVVIRWPVNAPLVVTAQAPNIANRLPLEDVQEEPGSLSGRLGDGETFVEVQAGGRVVLKPAEPEVAWEGEFGPDFAGDFVDMGLELAGLGERLASELESHMASLSANIEKRFGPDFAQKMAEKAALKAEKAMERVARRAERAQQRAERHAGRYGSWTEPPRPAPKPKATPEEQLKVLEMLEQGLISVEEANTLLKAMEGRE